MMTSISDQDESTLKKLLKEKYDEYNKIYISGFFIFIFIGLICVCLVLLL